MIIKNKKDRQELASICYEDIGSFIKKTSPSKSSSRLDVAACSVEYCRAISRLVDILRLRVKKIAPEGYSIDDLKFKVIEEIFFDMADSLEMVCKKEETRNDVNDCD